MNADERTRLIEEVRERRAKFPGATGWTPLHLDALLEEIDEAWEAGRRFAAEESRRHVPPAEADYVAAQILSAKRK